MAISTITSAGIATDTLTAVDIANDAIGTAELANDVVISTSGNITTTGKLSTPSIVQTDAQNLTGTYSTQELIMGKTFTLTGDLTVNTNLVLANMSATGSDITIQPDSTARTITSTGGSGILEGVTKAFSRTDMTGMTGVLGSAVTGELGSAVTGGSGLNASNIGISVADEWRLTADFTGAATITSNLERADGTGQGQIGSTMSQSSGIFTFPSTGYYLVIAHIGCGTAVSGEERSHGINIDVSVNTGGAYTNGVGTSQSSGYDSNDSTNYSTSAQCILDITNVSTHLLRFRVTTVTSGSITRGSSTQSITSFLFIRLGDT